MLTTYIPSLDMRGRFSFHPVDHCVQCCLVMIRMMVVMIRIMVVMMLRMIVVIIRMMVRSMVMTVMIVMMIIMLRNLEAAEYVNFFQERKFFWVMHSVTHLL